MLEKLLLQNKTAVRVWVDSVWHNYNPAIFALGFLVVLLLLQWVFNYELFFEILIENNARLPLSERINVFIDAIGNVFRYSNDLTPISLLLISFFQASILTIWWRSRQLKKQSKLAMGTLSVGIIGSGCVACGSSLLPLLIDVIGATLSVTLVQAIGDILLVLAVLLSYRAALKIALRASAIINPKQ